MHNHIGYTAVEVCTRAGGQAIGLEQAGFHPLALVEIDKNCCNTLLHNRPAWPVFNEDLNFFDGNL
ncbi:DNA cytosine methyltransferase [Chloroflexota bacterium]